MAVPPYGVAVRTAIASGDLEQMRSTQKEVEDYLREYGDVPAALEALKAEIAKAEGSDYKG
jgi:uncharacterized protein involved in exopolysaccharide biosynthesis